MSVVTTAVGGIFIGCYNATIVLRIQPLFVDLDKWISVSLLCHPFEVNVLKGKERRGMLTHHRGRPTSSC